MPRETGAWPQVPEAYRARHGARLWLTCRVSRPGAWLHSPNMASMQAQNAIRMAYAVRDGLPAISLHPSCHHSPNFPHPVALTTHSMASVDASEPCQLRRGRRGAETPPAPDGRGGTCRCHVGTPRCAYREPLEHPTPADLASGGTSRLAVCYPRPTPHSLDHPEPLPEPLGTFPHPDAPYRADPRCRDTQQRRLTRSHANHIPMIITPPVPPALPKRDSSPPSRWRRLPPLARSSSSSCPAASPECGVLGTMVVIVV
jgi:hypothetical protein